MEETRDAECCWWYSQLHYSSAERSLQLTTYAAIGILLVGSQFCQCMPVLGISIGYQIVTEKRYGKLECFSTPGAGAEFVIQLPIHQSTGN
jgi:hypothetical protein